MNFRKTFLFFLVFALIGGYYYLVEIKKAEETKETEKEEKRIFSPINREDISEVKIESGKKGPLRLLKVNNSWKIKEPVEANIDEDGVNLLLDYIARLPKERIVSETAVEKADYGLEKPSFSIHVTGKNSTSKTLYSGDEIPTGSMLYSKIKDKDQVFLLAVYDKNGVDKSLYDLRDKNIFRFKDENVQGIEVSTGAGKYALGKKEGVWQVEAPKKAPVESDKIVSLLHKIRTSEIKEFVEENMEENAEELTSYGLTKPEVEITLTLGKDKVSLALGKIIKEGEGGVYARVASKKKVFILKGEFLKEFPFRVNDVRDKTVLEFNRDRLSKVEFIYPDKTIVIALDNKNNWEIIQPEKFNADNFGVNALLNDIRDAKAIDFIPKTEDNKEIFALDNPKLTVKLFEADMDKPKTISFGSINQQKEVVFASTGSPDEVFVLSKDIYNKLSQTELSLMDRHLLVVEEEKIVSVHLETGKKEYLFAINQGKWTLNKPEKKELDTLKVKEVLWELGDIVFTDIIEENGKKGLEDFGLDKPTMKVNFIDGEQKNIESLFIGSKVKDKDLLYATTGKSEQIYTIEQNFQDALMNNLNKLVE